MNFVKVLLTFSFSLLIFSCQSAKSDLRQMAPAETLVYLETNNLGEAIKSLTQNKSFQELSRDSGDFSSLEKIEVSIAVTGFETSEKQLTEEAAILNFKPRFVLIADTHSWESTASSLIELNIGRYVKEQYGDEVKLDKGEKNGIRFFHWTSADNQKIFASVTGGLIFIGNDEATIDKCLAVKKGEAENLLKNWDFVQAYEKNKDEKNLAFGYITTEGIVQLSNLAGLTAAIGSSEQDIVRSFIAKNLPVLVQKTVTEIVWTARKEQDLLEDKLIIKTSPEISALWKESLAGQDNSKFATAQFLPEQYNSLTRYNLRDPQIAWKSILETSAKQLDGFNGRILSELSGSVFAPYAITDGESFLGSLGSEIVTVRFDQDGDRSVVIAEIRDMEKLRKSVSPAINLKVQPEKQGAANLWKSDDKLLAAALLEDKLVLGETESVLKCLTAYESGHNFTKSERFQRLANSKSSTLTIARDSETTERIVRILGAFKEEKKDLVASYLTETRFTAHGIERRTTSDFGLFGTIVEKIGAGK